MTNEPSPAWFGFGRKRKRKRKRKGMSRGERERRDMGVDVARSSEMTVDVKKIHRRNQP